MNNVKDTINMDTANAIERFIIDELLMSDGRMKLDHDQSLISSGVIDSLGILRLIAFVEERFGIQVDDEEVISENFETINIIKDFVESKR
jgi:acyl carrier protein